MCGIWALINLSKSKLDIAKYLADFWELQNRGPDNSCFETFPQAWVGFHRLAIMDTSFKSNQPYVLQEKDRTVVFLCNGEIYNFKYLISKYKLDIDGNSDCMTVPKLYMKYSENEEEWFKLFNKEIKGEFAFVLLEFDHLKSLRKIFVGRDQVGIRPLYYHHPTEQSQKLIFTSEIKGAKHFPDSISEYSPGFITKFELNEFGALNQTKYDFNWIYKVNQCLKIDEEEYFLNKIRNAVINAVRRRLDADRPIAFLLSGGVDSSLVSAIGQRILGVPIKTFCCGMKGGTDLKYAKMVADHIGSHHSEVYFTAEDGVNALEEVIYATETWDTTTVRASVGQFMVCKHIGTKTDCKVVLVGEGPDEVCSSYLFNWYAPNGEELDNAAKEYVKKIHYFDCRRGDRCISYWGLEGRVPLLDPEVIEAYWELPAEWRHPKYKGVEKWWLRKAFDGLGLLPDEVLWRKKEAFSDGVSSKERSWYEIIQEDCEKNITSEMMEQSKKEWLHHTPPTKEAYHFRKIFTDNFGVHRHNVLPNYWLPKWNKNGEEVNDYMDPSARVLDVYDE
jgi:asparagine synthase (glutamine-hydrolysing)